MPSIFNFSFISILEEQRMEIERKRNGLEIQCKERCSYGHYLLGTKTNHSAGRDRFLKEWRVWWAGS